MKIPVYQLQFGSLLHKNAGTFLCKDVFPGKIKDVKIELISIKGPYSGIENSNPDGYVVLLGLEGSAAIISGCDSFKLANESIVRPPYRRDFWINVSKGTEAFILKITKTIDKNDIEEISKNNTIHDVLFGCRFSDCSTYTENIKSAKTINRTILAKGYVPRFCLGSVKTFGPDLVANHSHPMLEQIFLGLTDCRCTCYAGTGSSVLKKNSLLHIPLGSNHHVTVEKGNTLYYLWLDLFLTLEGQSYLNNHHKTEQDHKVKPGKGGKI